MYLLSLSIVAFDIGVLSKFANPFISKNHAKKQRGWLGVLRLEIVDKTNA